MDTKTRILKESLALFNAEGEQGRAAIDIANALDISPGNLYYHFKGKDAVIHALFDDFEEEMQIILGGAKAGVSSIEDYWIYTHIVLEEIWDFRFFFRNLGALLERYPDLARRFRRLTDGMRAAISQIIEELSSAGELNIDDRLTGPVIDQSVQSLVFWLPMHALEPEGGGVQEAEAGLLQSAVFQTLAVIAPYLNDADAGVAAMIDRLDPQHEKSGGR